MPLFGSLHKSKSKESLEHHEQGKDADESQGSIFKHLVHRTSSSSTKVDPPVSSGSLEQRPSIDERKVAAQRSSDEVHRNSAEPRQHSHRLSSMSKNHSHHSAKNLSHEDDANTGDNVSAAHQDAPPSTSLGTVSRVAPDSTCYTYDGSAEENGLTQEDVHNLFSGAPHLTLEKGSHGRSFPQVFFPWDKNLEIADLVGRRRLEHESFALATLHAHLPIPDKLEWQPATTASTNRHAAFKRPAFELGIFEVPNMLGVHGKEPGTVGMQHFLELPIADRFRAEKSLEDGPSVLPNSIASLPCGEAFKALQHSDGSATIGKHAPGQDRIKLVQDGPQAWRRVGVRAITMQTLTDRLARISSWHEEVVSGGWKVTVLDKQDTKTLYNELFTSFLFPPQKVTGELDQESLKVQIEALLKVLTTPGAWVDISLVVSRLHLGQMLWEPTPHEGGDVGPTLPAPGTERRWLLVQLLLSIELVIRLDAALRLGLSQHSAEINISGYEIHHFNKLRNTKLDWDLVLARRFLDYFCVTQAPLNAGNTSVPVENPRRGGMLSGLKYKTGNHEDNLSACDCLILPRRPKIQLDGLLRFAKFLNWPDFQDFERRMLQRLENHCSAAPASTEPIYGAPIHCSPGVTKQLQTWNSPSTVDCDSKRVRNRHIVWLQAATATHPGGWLSRSWLTALVLPGETACDLLISTLLENEPEVLKKLGETALLHGGFSLGSRSWWSNACVVGRVFAPCEGGTQCMGWISTPKLLLVDERMDPLSSQWIDVESRETPSLREKTRIHDGVRMAVESSPLGMGKGKIMGNEFVIPGKLMCKTIDPTTVTLDHVALQKSWARTDSHNFQATKDGMLTASAQFTIRKDDNGKPSQIIYNLTYDVYFITAPPCRLPQRVVATTAAGVTQHLTQDHGEHLLSHPLHKTYQHVIKSINDLPYATPPNHTKLTEPTWIIDARNSEYKDVFVRAWCSQVGRHALVSRIGRTCLSCSIREARAIEVGIIIRVGGYE